MKPVKNITYPSKGLLSHVLANLPEYQGFMGMTVEIPALIIMEGQQREGVQFIVDKELSLDLEHSEIKESVHFEDVPWPARYMEFVFQDETLPTCLISIISDDELNKLGYPVYSKHKEGFEKSFRMAYYMIPDPNRLIKIGNTKVPYEQLFYINYTLPQMADFMTMGVHATISGCEGLTEEEQVLTKRIALLIVKVLLYAAVPRFAPAKLPEHPTRKMLPYGGAAGVKDRPKRPAYRVQYLPNVRRIEQEAALARIRAEGRKHVFKGRVGHFHHYRSEKFTNKKGTYEYYPPIPNPITGELPKVYKVRKVK